MKSFKKKEYSETENASKLLYEDLNKVDMEEEDVDVCSQIISISKKSPGSRTINDCKIVGTFLSEIKFLQKLDKNV